jgi:hypothetical protein
MYEVNTKQERPYSASYTQIDYFCNAVWGVPLLTYAEDETGNVKKRNLKTIKMTPN